MDQIHEQIDWSYSNAMLYESCPRSLFYRYWQQDQTGDSLTDDQQAEHMWYSSTGALIGVAVHAGIGSQIQRWAHGKSTSRDEAHDKAAAKIEAASLSSAHTGRIDHAFDREAVMRTATDHIDRFLSVIWPQLRSGRYITHEEVGSFELGDTTVWVRPDLCHRNDEGEFVITDWKTRSPKVFEDPTLQLRTYALWAQTKFEPQRDRLRLQLGFTGSGELRVQKLTESRLQETRKRIQTDTEQWGDPNNQSAFPVNPDLEKCQSCSYLPSCPDGQDVVSSPE